MIWTDVDYKYQSWEDIFSQVEVMRDSLSFTKLLDDKDIFGDLDEK